MSATVLDCLWNLDLADVSHYVLPLCSKHITAIGAGSIWAEEQLEKVKVHVSNSVSSLASDCERSGTCRFSTEVNDIRNCD